MALLVAARAGPRAGRLIDRHGGRTALPFTNAIFALGLVLLASAQGGISLFGAWFVLNVAMGFGLYDAAFAALMYLYGVRARQVITGITLIAGFASTVGWPLSAAMQTAFGWRGALLACAVLHVLLGVILNRRIPQRPMADAPGDPAASRIRSLTLPAARTGAASNLSHATALLVFAFAATGFVGTAMAAHLPTVL
jgi:MFS family permease